MWAAMVQRAGVGPAPCSIDDLTEDILVDRLVDLQKPEYKSKAEWMAEQMAQEDGIEGGLDHFLSSLPRDNAFCDVSLFLGEPCHARVRLKESGLKVSREVASLLTLRTNPAATAQPSGFLRGPLRDLAELFEHWKRSQRYGSYQMEVSTRESHFIFAGMCSNDAISCRTMRLCNTRYPRLIMSLKGM